MLLTDDIILYLYCAIADVLGEKDTKHVQAKLYVSEIILCGVLFVLRGISFRRFWKWLWEQTLFAQLPERSRLQRLVITKKDMCNEFAGDPTLFSILDSFGIEMIVPIRQYQSKQMGKLYDKGKSNHRWIIGRKIAVTINGNLEIVELSDATDNVHDGVFDDDHKRDDSITLTDQGFKKKEGTPATFKICKRGRWNDRMDIETIYSLWTRMCNLKRSFHRTIKGFQAKMSYLIPLQNIIVNLNEQLGFGRMSLVQWSI